MKKESPAAKGGILKTARTISLIFHPFAVAPLALIFALYLSGIGLLAALWWAGVCVLFLTIPLVTYLFHKVTSKQFSDADVSVREQRQGIYFFGAICMIVCFGVLLWLRAPDIMIELFGAGLAMVVLFALVTRFVTKVSVHTGIMTGATVVVAFYSWPWALVLAAATLVVAWSRLMLKRHSMVEIISGASISGTVFFLAMLTKQ